MRSLSDLRSEIDAIDAELLRLVEARSAVGRAIGEAKAREATDGAPVCLLRPDREALLLRRLLASPRTAASDGIVRSVWRELISESLRIQSGGMTVCLSGRDPSRDVLLWARERFGFGPAFTWKDDALAVVAAARDVSTVGVLSLDGRAGAWWARLLAEPKVRIVAALPEMSAGLFHAAAVASLAPEPTGDDVTFWVSDAPGSDNRLIATLGERGFAADMVCAAQGARLFALSGFVQERDPRLEGLGALSGVIGAAPRV